MYFAWSKGIGQITSGGHVTFGDLSPDTPTSVVDGPDGNLWFVDRHANSIGEVAPASLFGGGQMTGPPPPPTTRPLSPKVRLTVARQRLSTVRTHRRLIATCALAGAGRCTVTANVTARTARALHLTVAKKAKTVTLARASRTLTQRGKVTLTLALSRTLATALTHTKTLTLTVTATSRVKGAKPRRISNTLNLKS
jgi:hypothetical protein